MLNFILVLNFWDWANICIGGCTEFQSIQAGKQCVPIHRDIDFEINHAVIQTIF